MRRARPTTLAAAATALAATVLAGCSLGPGGASWPDPAADRPVVDLSYTMSSGLDAMTGTERVTFTPDKQICELVFRAWPNKPGTAETGNSLTVDSVTVGGQSLPLTVAAAGAPSGRPGTLVTAKLPSCSAAGTPVTADLAFAATLGARTDERVGYSPRSHIAWLGTAFPLLAWQRGVGWVTDPAVPVVGDTATSETFRLERLQVRAPSQYVVAGVGQESGEPQQGGDGTSLHTFTADAVRDVTVTVGDLVRTTTQVGDTTVNLFLPSGGSRGSAEEWSDELGNAVTALEAHFGAMPYSTLWISVLPGVSDGVEYPGAVQFSDVDPNKQRWLVLHELAHMYFYGLVGDNQAQHPWLDEAFATYAQEVVLPTRGGADCAPAPSGVGRPLSAFVGDSDPDEAYVAAVYQGGACALLKARAAVGDDAFDEALRGYLEQNAWAIAKPADVANSLAELPEALEVLRQAGALTQDEVRAATSAG